MRYYETRWGGGLGDFKRCAGYDIFVKENVVVDILIDLCDFMNMNFQ